MWQVLTIILTTISIVNSDPKCPGFSKLKHDPTLEKVKGKFIDFFVMILIDLLINISIWTLSFR